MSWRPVATGVFLLGLTVRLGYVAQVSDAAILAGDGRLYEQIARSLATGHGFARTDGRTFGGEETPDKRGATFFSPLLYPIFVSLFFRAGLGLRAVVVGQAVLGALAMLLLVRIAWERFGETCALVVGLLGGVSPFLIPYEGSLLTESLTTDLVVLGLFLTHRYLARPSAGLALGNGVAVALGTMCRPPVQLFGLALLVLWATRFVRGRREALVHAGVFVATMLVVLSPWMIRNYRGMGVLYFTTTAVPYNVFLGWGSSQLHMYEARTLAEYRTASQELSLRRREIYERNRDLSYWERTQAFRREGIRYVVENPAAAGRLWTYKIRHFFTPGVNRLLFPWPLVIVSWFWETPLFVASAVGMWVSRRSEPEILGTVLLMIGLVALGYSLVHVEIRYRVPFVEPVAILYAGVAAAAGRRWVLARRFPRPA